MRGIEGGHRCLIRPRRLTHSPPALQCSVNPYTFYLSALVSNELDGQTFTAEPGDINPTLTGEQYLDYLGFAYSERWRNWALLLMVAILCRVATYIGLAYKVHLTR